MKKQTPILFDRWLLLSVFCIIGIGLLMVTSASIVISTQQYGHPFHYLAKQAIFLGAGFVLSVFILRVDSDWWFRYSPYFLIASIILLIVVLIPGVGREVNGSTRWINLGFIGFQVSEFAKLCAILYISGYLVRQQAVVRNHPMGFIRPMILLSFVAFLLLLEPDFGASVVIMATVLAMMFLAGVRLWQFAVLVAIVLAALAVLAISSPYRLERLTTFLNPWANQFDSGYQLTQSLIAFGRGGLTGVGLGDSVQKLFYLPEAHTDFLFAVLAEELGLVGVLVVIALYVLLTARIFHISRMARQADNLFASYLAFGLGLWIAIQAMINIGVNSGVLPTKGLTLPLMSYGGSSMVTNCVILAIIFRIDFETRLKLCGLRR